MLTLGHLPSHNLQMDWSLDPIKKGDGIEMEADEEFPEIQNLTAPDAVARHFEDSLRILSTIKSNGPTSNGYYPQSRPNEFGPYMPWGGLDNKSVIPQTPAQLSPEPSPKVTPQQLPQLSTQQLSPQQLTPQQLTPQQLPQLSPQQPPQLSPQQPPQLSPQPPPQLTPQQQPQLSPQQPPQQPPKLTPQQLSPQLSQQQPPQLTPQQPPQLTPQQLSPHLSPHLSPQLSPQPPPPPPSPPHVNDMPMTPQNPSPEQSSELPSSSTEPATAPPPQTTPLPRPTPSPYDVENISNILKAIEINRFINSSILHKNVFKEDRPDSTTNSSFKSNTELIIEELPDSTQPESNGGVNNNQKRPPSSTMWGAGVLQKKIKQESPPVAPPLLPISTEVDIEAELPCSSIKQRPGTNKKPRKRKNGDTLPVKPARPVGELKQSKRNTKRNTNYREASSDEEDMPKIAFNPRSRTKPVQPATVVPTAGEVKKEPTSGITPQTIDTQAKTEPEIKAQGDNEIKTDLPPTPSEEIQQKIKLDNTDEDEIEDVAGPSQPGSTQQPSAVKAKPNRVRNPAAMGARKPKLHPLTRKEQLMMTKLQQTKEPFLQNLPCLKLASKISKCRECRCASLRSDSVFCRFYDFRRLRYKENAIIVLDGFSDPNKDPGPADIALWKPETPPKDIDMNVCRFILMHVGDQFCRIWHEEQTALEEHMSPNKTIAWKKVVKGVREICDVCETTLFNFHWTCSKCGFGVCIDCYKDRKRKRLKKIDKPQRGFDEYGWHTCTMRDTHEMIDLMLTQIIPGNALNFLTHRLHEVCRLWKIPQRCNCAMSLGIQQVSFTPRLAEISVKIIKDAYLRFYSRESEVTYREKIKGLNPQDMKDRMQIMKAETELIKNAKSAGTLPIVLATTLKHLGRTPNADDFSQTDTVAMQDEVTKEYEEWAIKKRPQRYLPQKVMNLRKFQNMFPGIDHDWLCNGKLLRLLEARNSRNVMMFQEVWKRGQPVMVSELCKFLNISLWHPEAFCRDFGERKNDLINCMTGNLVPNQPMKLFWEGFQCVSKRLVDASGEPMLLKLKDWPPGDDFAEILPTRFADLMSALPLPEYTLRTGTLNIASRLPNIFVPPDLGPKMYNAYGSALHPDKGTTNLHLDISDAVNIMVYVGIPTDASAKAQIRAAMRAIDSGGCDLTTRRRVRQAGVMPGALWHIYSARDAEKIRDLLNRVTIERGFRLEPDHDPIHDQNWYLDNELRERLYDDYGVEGFPIVQCLGDAVFIPAGAPHQVRNLHNCIKVAEDFVSPENIEHCFHLSQQFRKLSMSHTNHEDKLQIRNVIYHAVKDTTSYLTYLLNRQL